MVQGAELNLDKSWMLVTLEHNIVFGCVTVIYE